MSIKQWNILNSDTTKSKDLCEKTGLSPFIIEMLVARGFDTFDKIEELIEGEDALENPFVLADMQKAVDRIKIAIENFEKIVVYGDYDCDGVTSTTILCSYLSLSGANVIFHIPSREKEGYGLNCGVIEQLHKDEVNLIITVDNGISAFDEIDLANSLGIDVIVTDHHQPSQKLPKALAIVNPHRKDCKSDFKFLAGVGVAFKLIAALENGDYDYALSQFAEIVAIGTIGDIVPLIGENRTLVKIGIEQLKQTDNLGLLALMQVAKIKAESLNSQNIAFGIVPRINAVGRMQDATLAVKLLLSIDFDEAMIMAENIDELNANRRASEKQILDDIEEIIKQNPKILNKRVLIFNKEGWHHGIIGIVSAKILEKYGKPNIIFTTNEDNLLTGSARSVPTFSLFEALSNCSEHLQRFGGHTQAAGMSLKLEDLEKFDAAIQEYAKNNYNVMPCFSYQVDRVIHANEFNIQNIKSLEMLEPFGERNQYPLFLVKGAKLTAITPVSQNKHLRLSFNYNGVEVSAMKFSCSTDDFFYKPNQVLDFLATISINPFNGKEYLSVIIKDIRPAKIDQTKVINAKNYYEKFCLEENLSKTVVQKAIPTREEITIIYKFINNQKTIKTDIDEIYFNFLDHDINYCKYRLILDILKDANLIEISALLDMVGIIPAKEKVNLENTNTLKRLNLLNKG